MAKVLTQNDIDKFFRDLDSLGFRYPVSALEDKLGYGKGTISLYLSKKAPPSDKFINKFYQIFGNDLKNVPHETDAILKKVLTVDNSSPILPAGDLSMQAIVNLTQSNRTLAESNKILATSHQDLVEMVKAATADVGPKTTVDDLSRSRDFLAIIAELGVGKLWKSKQEALAKLNKFFAEPEKSNA